MNGYTSVNNEFSKAKTMLNRVTLEYFTSLHDTLKLNRHYIQVTNNQTFSMPRNWFLDILQGFFTSETS